MHLVVDETMPVTGEFPSQRASSAENVSIWWRHHVIWITPRTLPKSASQPVKYVHNDPVTDFFTLNIPDAFYWVKSFKFGVAVARNILFTISFGFNNIPPTPFLTNF